MKKKRKRFVRTKRQQYKSETEDQMMALPLLQSERAVSNIVNQKYANLVHNIFPGATGQVSDKVSRRLKLQFAAILCFSRYVKCEKY